MSNQNQSKLLGALSALLYRYELVALLLGGVIGHFIYAQTEPALKINGNAAASIAFTLGQNGYTTLWLVMMVCGACIGFVAFRTLHSLVMVTKPSASEDRERRRQDSFNYRLPPFPSSGDAIRLVFGESHEQDGTYSKTPTWYQVGEYGLYGNIIAFGGIGSGKTQAVAYPILRQFFEFKCDISSLRFAGLIMDVKGDFSNQVIEMAEAYGRANDVVIIRPNGRYKWNPINDPEAEPEVLAGRLMTVFDNLNANSSGSGDARWVRDGAFKLITHCIGLQRLAYGYVTIQDVFDLATEMSQQQEEGEEKHPLDIALEAYGEAFNAREVSQEDKENYEYYAKFFSAEWKAEYKKHKTTILSEVSNLCKMFAKPNIAKTFCPNQTDIDFPGFHQLINDGAIVCLGMTTEEHGPLAQAIGILIKLEFQRAVLGRVKRAAKGKVNNNRPCLFMADEYQNFVSTGSNSAGAEGDDNFYALSRQSKCCSVVLTQSPVSLYSKIGDMAARVIMASLRTKVFLTITDTQDANLAADICGKSYQMREQATLSESVNDAGWDVLSNSMEGSDSTVSESVQFQQNLEHELLPVKFQRLRTFESIISGFNGQKQLLPQVVYLKPNFAPKDKPYNQIALEVEQQCN